MAVIMYKGVIYPSIKKLSEACGVKYATLTLRLQKGWSVDKAVTSCNKNHGGAKSIEYEGVNYPSLKKLSEAYNVKYNTLAHRLRSGWSIEKAINTNIISNRGIPVEYNGKKYSSYAELAVAYGIQPKTLWSRLQHGWRLGDALTEKIGKRGRKRQAIYPTTERYCAEDYTRTCTIEVNPPFDEWVELGNIDLILIHYALRFTMMNSTELHYRQIQRMEFIAESIELALPEYPALESADIDD